MKKIKRIESMLNRWKAKVAKVKSDWGIDSYVGGDDIIHGLELALEEAKRLSNTKLQIDAKIVCNEDCVAPSKDCYYFKMPGCRWHN